MPFAASGEFSLPYQIADQQALDPAVLDAQFDDMARGLSAMHAEMARVARGAGQFHLPKPPPAGISREQVIEIVDAAIARIQFPSAIPVDVMPLIERIAGLEAARPEPVASQPPGNPVDLAPILERLRVLESAVTTTRGLIYRSIVADRRLREALAAYEDPAPADLMDQGGVAYNKYPILSAERPGVSNNVLRTYAGEVWMRETIWAARAAGIPVADAADLETAIAAFEQGM